MYYDIVLGKRKLPNSLQLNSTRSENSHRLSLKWSIYNWTLSYRNLVTVILSTIDNNVGNLAVTYLLGAGRPSYSFGGGDNAIAIWNRSRRGSMPNVR